MPNESDSLEIGALMTRSITASIKVYQLTDVTDTILQLTAG